MLIIVVIRDISGGLMVLAKGIDDLYCNLEGISEFPY